MSGKGSAKLPLKRVALWQWLFERPLRIPLEPIDTEQDYPYPEHSGLEAEQDFIRFID